jgi:hypothetical protein
LKPGLGRAFACVNVFASDQHRTSVFLLGAILSHLKLTAWREKSTSCNGIALHFSQLRRRELPSKTIAKNIAQIITYPHSDFKRFEKPRPPEAA